MAINTTVENINNQPTIQPRTVTGIFTKYIAKTLPLAFDESMSYYECLCALLEYLNETIVPDINNTNDGLSELQGFYLDLQDYVNTYFDNLDVQQEINNKLDEMVESGELQELLERQYEQLENEIDNRLIVMNNALEQRIEQQDIRINSAVSGSPLVASSTSGMTDTSRVYVNTTDGKWYYYNGTTWAAGGTYQGTTINPSDETIVELNSRLNQYMHYYYFNESASFNTPFKIKTGQKVYMNITSVTAGITIFTTGFASNVYKSLNSGSTGAFEITVTNDGPLRFYFASAGNVQGYAYIENKLSDDINSLKELKYNYIPDITSFENIQLKRQRVYSNFTNLTNKGYTFNSSATIENIENYETTSTVSLPTPVIRVRDNLGNLIYNNLTVDPIDDITQYNTATCIWTFGKDEKYLRNLSFYEFKQREDSILNDEYYVILNKYPNVSGYKSLDWIINNINIDWINNTDSNVYYVGSDGDFTTFTEMLIALKDDMTPKTVYVKPGVYDIFEEMGGSEYMAEIFNTATSLNWRDVCHIVPDNTKIIGIGNVILKWEATAGEMMSNDVAYLFSPLNVSGNCYIENITVIGQNCRYTVHDETSGLSKYDGATHEFKNCNFIYKQSTYGVLIDYGSGHNKNMNIKFTDCTFDSYYSYMWSTHDWTASINENSNYEFNNCIFINSSDPTALTILSFISSDTVGRKDKVKFNNCYINGKLSYTTSSNSEVRQGYEITLIGSSKIETQYNDLVTTRYDTKEYNYFE